MNTFLTVILFLALGWLIPIAGILTVIAVCTNDYDTTIWPYRFLRYFDYDKTFTLLSFKDFYTFYQLSPESWYLQTKDKHDIFTADKYYNLVTKVNIHGPDLYFRFKFFDYLQFCRFIKNQKRQCKKKARDILNEQDRQNLIQLNELVLAEVQRLKRQAEEEISEARHIAEQVNKS